MTLTDDELRIYTALRMNPKAVRMVQVETDKDWSTSYRKWMMGETNVSSVVHGLIRKGAVVYYRQDPLLAEGQLKCSDLPIDGEDQ